MNKQIERNHKRVKNYLKEKNLNAVILASRANFAWFTAGGLNYVNAASEQGIAAIYIDPDNCVCVTDNKETARIREEELANTGIEIRESLWYDCEQMAGIWKDLAGGKNIAADIDVTPLNAKPLDADFDKLRFELSETEIQNYRELGKIAGICLEEAGKVISPGMSELEIASIMSGCCLRSEARPWVILIAADDRIKKYRHPIPTANRLEKMVELILCVEKYGLIVSCTRIISFGPLDEDTRKRHDAVVNIDTAFITSTQPGTKLKDIFNQGLKAYEESGFPDEWKLHHQGGPCGYLPRDFVAGPDIKGTTKENQAFAWNPSITGTKSEDTIITTKNQPEIISLSENWPMIEGQWQGRKVARSDILVR